MKLKIKVLDPEVGLPTRAHSGDAGLDLRSRLEVALAPGERRLVPCGIAVEIPEGYVGLVLPRSGISASRGLSFVNACGVIDAGYRGEISVIAVNLDPRAQLRIEKGERIAQLLVVPVAQPEVECVEELSPSDRGEGGFGSSGTR